MGSDTSYSNPGEDYYNHEYIIEGLYYYISPLKGFGSSTKYLTFKGGYMFNAYRPVGCVSKSSSGDEKLWKFEKVSTNKYILKVRDLSNVTSIEDNKTYHLLSGSTSGGVVDGYPDDKSGRQYWVFKRDWYNTLDNVFYIHCSGVSDGRYCLGMNTDGRGVETFVFNKDDEYIKWVIHAAAVKLKPPIKFDEDRGTKKFLNKREFTVDVNNKTYDTQTSKFTFSRTYTEESSFTHESGFSTTIQTDVKCPLPILDSGKISVSQTMHTKNTKGERKSNQTVFTFEQTLNVSQNNKYKAKVSLEKYQLTVPYTAIFVSDYNSKEVTQSGTWIGTAHVMNVEIDSDSVIKKVIQKDNDYQKLLKSWNLGEYISAFKQEGNLTDVNKWQFLEQEDLINIFKMPTYDARSFMKNKEEFFRKY